MDKISQQELIDMVSLTSGNSKSSVKSTLVALTVAIKEYTKKGQSVSLAGLGVFKPADRAARTCVNPITGYPVHVPKKRVLTFKQSSKVDLNQ